MNRITRRSDGTTMLVDALLAIRGRWMLVGAAAFLLAVPAMAQNATPQQKVAAIVQAAAANKQALQQYQWVETQQLTLNGEQKPATQYMCHYAPDGTVQKTEIGAPPAPSGGRFKQRLIADKKPKWRSTCRR